MTTVRGDGPLRFATYLAPNMLPVYRFLAEQISTTRHPTAVDGTRRGTSG